MRHLFLVLTIFFYCKAFAQKNTSEDFGFRHFQTIYKRDTVDILVKSKKGEELKKKPIFLFCQGSLPIPLIIKDGDGAYGTFPFKTDSLEMDYHIAIVSKPFVPLIVEASLLGRGFTYHNPLTKDFPVNYSHRNLLDYYVLRNLKVIDFLQKLDFVDDSKLIVAGHSEGSTIASKLTTKCKKVTHLIYAGGNPFGRILSIIAEARVTESDSTKLAEYEFDYWQQVVNDKNSMDNSKGDTNKATYDFSIPPITYLEKLKIPVLICYGTKDWSAPYNDFLRVEMLRQQKTNFTFNAYIGLEHNFFPLTTSGQPNYDIFNWDKVAADWWNWLR
jgi:dienelactone hydrolase